MVGSTRIHRTFLTRLAEIIGRDGRAIMPVLRRLFHMFGLSVRPTGDDYNWTMIQTTVVAATPNAMTATAVLLATLSSNPLPESQTKCRTPLAMW